MLLSLAAKRLSEKNVLVKDLHGVETLGSITLLATDKTGTLTQNKMSIAGAWLDKREYSMEANGEQRASIKSLEGVAQICALCTRYVQAC